MPSSELQQFVNAAKERGAADEFLASLLTRRGWPSRDAYNALADWWERSTSIPIPVRRGTTENARDGFLYLLAFSTLATWACGLGSLWFQLIEHWMPDSVINPYVYNFRGMVTRQIACILVALPIYLLVMRVIVRESRANSDRVESGVRKWLTYIALLLAAIGVVSDLVCFVDYFLRGGLTVRFVLKCAVVLAICGSILWYYLDFLRGRPRNGWFAAEALILAFLAVGFGLNTTGTPAAQRHLEADRRRIEDLRSIANTMHSMPALPHSIADIQTERPGLRVRDPESGVLYSYSPKSADEFELCATFYSSNADREPPYANQFWSHRAGRACFAFDRKRPVAW